MLLDKWGRMHPVPTFALLGRDRDKMDVAIGDPSVSRSHALLEHQQERGRWRLTDLGSTNGTIVGNEAVSGPGVVVADRDRVVIGHVAFVFTLDLASVDGKNPPLILHDVGSDGGDLVLFSFTDGKGIATYGPRCANLEAIELAFVKRLAERAVAECDRDQATRGYVLHLELVHTLPWRGLHRDTRPVAQLAAAVQRRFASDGLACVIESASRYGYRLR